MAEHTFAGLTCSHVAEASGSFVLGAVEDGEATAIRAHLAACPEPHPEMGELGSVVPALFESVDLVPPPASLRTRILDAAAAEARDGHGAPDSSLKGFARATRPEPVRRAEPKVRTGGALFRRPIWAALAGVAAVLAIALGAWNLQLRTEIDGLVAYRNGVVEVLDEAAKPGAQLAVLHAPDNASGPSGLAAVAADGTVAIVMKDLAPTSGAAVYEAWLIAGEAAPVAIGGFTVGGSGSASFTTATASLGEGVTVALTLEPGPGAKTPTGPVVAAGAATSAS